MADGRTLPFDIQCACISKSELHDTDLSVSPHHNDAQ